ncbi:MAG: phosphatase PAP2 family protein [Gammaproteobacteria bacterium]
MKLAPGRRWRLAGLLALAGAALLRAGADALCPGDHCRLPDFDAAALIALHGLQTPTLDALFRTVTQAGGIAVLAPFAALVAFIDWRGDRGRAAGFVPLALALGWALAHVGKELVQRSRPEIFAALVPLPASSSFPSGHAAQVAAFALAVALRPGTRTAWPAWIALGLLVMLVCLSRVYLQVHYPSDVMAGALAAMLWVAALRVAPVWGGRR